MTRTDTRRISDGNRASLVLVRKATGCRGQVSSTPTERRGMVAPTTTTAGSYSDSGAQRALDAEAQEFERSVERLRQRLARGTITVEEKLVETCRLVSESFGTDPRSDERYFTPGEVLGWFARAVEMGAEPTVIAGRTVRHLFTRRAIPNAYLRERFEALQADGEMSAYQLAVRIGVTKKQNGRTVGDATAVERMLGITTRAEKDSKGREYQSLRLFVSCDQAEALADALGLTCHDIGI